MDLALNLSHNPAGGLESVLSGNGVVTTITPDIRNRPSHRLIEVGSDTLLDHGYGYDIFGNISTIGPTTYIYDNLNRLTHAQDISGRGFSCTYDSVGNMLSLSKTNPVETATFSYINNRVTGLTYDADGNLTDDGVNTYVYDALGQTASITHSGGVTEHRYDAMGKRLVKTDAAADAQTTFLTVLGFGMCFDPLKSFVSSRLALEVKS
jgi:YD repeat-containing protein